MSKRQLQTFIIRVQWRSGASENHRRRATHSLDAFRQWREGLSYDDGVQIERFTVSPAEEQSGGQSQ